MRLKRHYLNDGSGIYSEQSTGNIWADLDYPDAEERLMKTCLASHIDTVIKTRGLTQTQAAKLVGMHQSDISNIVRGRFEQCSIERLLKVLSKLGYNVYADISEKVLPDPKPRPKLSGKLADAKITGSRRVKPPRTKRELSTTK